VVKFKKIHVQRSDNFRQKLIGFKKAYLYPDSVKSLPRYSVTCWPA